VKRPVFQSWLPPRPRAAHKNDFGHVLVIGGSRGLMGAPRLAAAGALRAGAGLATMAVPDSLEVVAAVGGPWEAMTLPLPDRRGALTPRAAEPARAFLRRRRATSVVLGPGLSMAPSAARFVEKFLAVVDVPVVLDADGLNAVAAGAWPARRPPLVLTPHAGEMARLLGVTTAVVEKDRRGAARAAARRFGAVVVLKGWGTVVTDGKVDFVAGVGNPGLATGGTGDVLAGVIGALIGQARGPAPAETLRRAAVLGVWLHGRAGDRAARARGEISLVAGDVVDALPAAFADAGFRR
jgi:NAD(P)H-hydrate epimerase